MLCAETQFLIDRTVSRMLEIAARNLQEAAEVACRQLGFQAGVFREVEGVPDGTPLRPPWLGRIPCTSAVGTISECGPLDFGETGTCGLSQRLACNNGDGAAPITFSRFVEARAVDTCFRMYSYDKAT